MSQSKNKRMDERKIKGLDGGTLKKYTTSYIKDMAT